MNRIQAFLEENRAASLLAAVFLLLAGIAGWFAYGSWDGYFTARQANDDAIAELNRLGKQSPAPSEANLEQLTKTLNSEQASLKELLKALQKYRIPEIPGLEKAKPQDAPRILQDALREQVTKLKSQATAAGAVLPAGFYLALEDYESRLPSPDDTALLAKQITVFGWIAEKLLSHSGLIIAEFSKPGSSSGTSTAKTERKTPSANAPKGDLPYENRGVLKLSFRCDQGSLREILNSFSASPYFLVIDSLQLQNTATEPPRRESGSEQANPPDAAPSQDGQATVKRLPIIVGREEINVSLRINVLEFPDRNPKQTNPAK